MNYKYIYYKDKECKIPTGGEYTLSDMGDRCHYAVNSGLSPR